MVRFQIGIAFFKVAIGKFILSSDCAYFVFGLSLKIPLNVYAQMLVKYAYKFNSNVFCLKAI